MSVGAALVFVSLGFATGCIVATITMLSWFWKDRRQESHGAPTSISKGAKKHE